jgi:hypothetical protein
MEIHEVQGCAAMMLSNHVLTRLMFSVIVTCVLSTLQLLHGSSAGLLPEEPSAEPVFQLQRQTRLKREEKGPSIASDCQCA